MSSDLTSLSSFHSSTDLRPQFAMTTAGVIVTSITAILSTLSSMLILVIIYNSPDKISTTYHRLIGLMSVFDIIASVSISLTTLPMPSDDILRFAGPMLGNHLTCSLQGYFITLGCSGSSALYLCLSWYFVCRITFSMDPYKISKRIEPLFYIFTTVMAIALPIYFLISDTYHTSYSDQFCILAPDHRPEYTNCTLSSNYPPYVFINCDYRYSYTAQDMVVFFTGGTLAMIIIAMMIIICTILSKNKVIKETLHEHETPRNVETPNHDYEDVADNISELRYSRVLVIQALMYILAYLITWAFMVAPMAINYHPEPIVIDTLEVFKSILFPLQGFWNLFIFVFDKAYLVYRTNTNGQHEHESIWKILKSIIMNPPGAENVILPASLAKVKGTSIEDSFSDNDFNHANLTYPSNNISDMNLSSPNVSAQTTEGDNRLSHLYIYSQSLGDTSSNGTMNFKRHSALRLGMH